MAAANSVFGRWDDTKAEENIDFMPTILSRLKTLLSNEVQIKMKSFGQWTQPIVKFNC